MISLRVSRVRILLVPGSARRRIGARVDGRPSLPLPPDAIMKRTIQGERPSTIVYTIALTINRVSWKKGSLAPE